MKYVTFPIYDYNARSVKLDNEDIEKAVDLIDEETDELDFILDISNRIFSNYNNRNFIVSFDSNEIVANTFTYMKINPLQPKGHVRIVTKKDGKKILPVYTSELHFDMGRYNQGGLVCGLNNLFGIATEKKLDAILINDKVMLKNDMIHHLIGQHSYIKHFEFYHQIRLNKRTFKEEIDEVYREIKEEGEYHWLIKLYQSRKVHQIFYQGKRLEALYIVALADALSEKYGKNVYRGYDYIRQIRLEKAFDPEKIEIVNDDEIKKYKDVSKAFSVHNILERKKFD